MSTNTTKTLEQLQAEAAEASKKFHEAQEAARRAEREAREEAVRQERLAKQRAQLNSKEATVAKLNKAADGVVAALRAALKAEKIDLDVTLTPGAATFDEKDGLRTFYPRFVGLPYGAEIHFEDAGRGSNYYSRPEAPVSVVIIVGSYGNRSRFPMKKDGTFSADKIGKEVAGRVAARIAEDKRSQDRVASREGSKQIVARVREQCGLKEYTSVVDVYEHDPRKVAVKLNLACTEAQAVELITLAKKMGFVKY